MRTTARRTVLISGASAAGPAPAYWPHRSGFAVTVVEEAVDSRRFLHAALNLPQPEPPHRALRHPAARRDLVSATFAGAGREVPRMVDVVREADDLFVDTAARIRMFHCSGGRVALVGDAAYPPSFLTGQGSSPALADACTLAHALATNPDHTTAFAAHERGVREFVAVRQALVDTGAATLFPTTARALEQRDTGLRDLVTMPSATPRPAHSALTLPDMP